MIRRFLDAVYLLSGILAACFLVAVFTLMMLLSAGREVGMNIPSGDDFTAWALAASTFLGLAHTFKAGDMIRVGLVLERLSGRRRQALEIFALLISVAFIGFFAKNAIQMAWDSYRFGDTSMGVVAVPLWIPQSGYALGLLILCLAMVDELVRVARGLRPTYEKEAPTSPEELVERIASGGGA
ncbi:MAG: TRAP transporter small permease [Rhizobiales bacterium]|nr:TRAP transporter small permease [Hyphomicrobiales bacterium]